MILKIETLSYTLPGSGEGDTLIDNDIIFDRVGIPYIPGKRMKGLLRESAIEILEILGLESYSLVYSLFGVQGSTKGKLKIPNLYIRKYSEISRDMESLVFSKKAISKSELIEFFTDIREETAIDDNGIAKDNSLRTSRVLKPGFTFECDIDGGSLTEKEKALFCLLCMNLRRIGTRRNRGFGKVKCSIEPACSIEDAMKVLRDGEDSINTETQETKVAYDSFKESNSVICLPFKIKTKSPVLISTQGGDQNVVNTCDYIPATTIRGIFASQLIKKLGISQKAHENNLFNEVILSGKVLIKPAFPIKDDFSLHPAPLNIRKVKGESDKTLLNVFREPPEGRKTKALNGFIALDNGNACLYRPEKVMFFHNARSRLEGRSTGESIFYYEAISKDEEFYGEMYGPEGLLIDLRNCMGSCFNAEIGRSKTSQYGEIVFEFLKMKQVEKKNINGKTFVISAQTPILLYNDYGFSDPTVEGLKNYLKQYFGNGFKITNFLFKLARVENYIGVWGSKTSKELALGEGSVFEIEFQDDLNDTKLSLIKNMELRGIGERTKEGFGQVRIETSFLNQYERKSFDKERSRDEALDEESIAILKSIICSKSVKYAKGKGIDAALGSDLKILGIMSPHLVSRVEKIIDDANDFNEIKDKLDNLKSKQAGKTLDKCKLLGELYDFDKISSLAQQNVLSVYTPVCVPLSILTPNSKLELYKSYWKKYLRTLRMLMKQKGGSNG